MDFSNNKILTSKKDNCLEIKFNDRNQVDDKIPWNIEGDTGLIVILLLMIIDIHINCAANKQFWK